MKPVIQILTLLVLIGVIASCPDKGYDYISSQKGCKANFGTWEACAQFCADHDPCFRWTWNLDTNECCTILKENYQGRTKNEKMISGIWTCNTEH